MSAFHSRIDLAGWWRIRFDEADQGLELGWADRPPADCRLINLPSCWNEVFPEYFHYDGTAWYFKDIYLKAEDLAERVLLSFEGVNYRCQVFLNGQPVGAHEGGFTGFSLDITRAARPAAPNRIAVRVNAALDEWTLPPSGVDWFNYGGIYRPVSIETTRAAFIEDLTLKTGMDGTLSLDALVKNSGPAGTFRITAVIEDETGQPVAAATSEMHSVSAQAVRIPMEMKIPDPHLWNPLAAYLYRLRLDLADPDGEVYDRKEQRFGLREIRVSGHKILVNGKEVKLVGCSKHDEYPLTGRAVSREQLVKDYDLLRQMNANFVRLAHYPHSRLEHEILDELGILAISEIPLVFLREAQMTSPETLEKSRRMLAEMIQAEKNTTSILFWSLFIECETDLPSTRPFVKALVDLTRQLDDTRLIVMASNRPLSDVAYDYFDVVGVNYWEGWYGGATVPEGIDFLASMAERYPDRPLLITSHGWEGLYGVRSFVEKTPWSEDSQSTYLSSIADVYMSYKNIAGEIVWTFADFRVSNWRDISEPAGSLSYLGRPFLVNHKGMVDFYRSPKSTYFIIKDKFAEWLELSAPVQETLGAALRVRVFSKRTLASSAAAFDFFDRARDLLSRQDTMTVLFATGASQAQFLQSLVQNKMFVDWRRINAFHLDEYVGIQADHPSGFVRWLRERLIDRLPFRRFEALNSLAANPEAECQRYAELLSQVKIDLACIGIGENGHIAFNDPPVANFEDPFLVKLVRLDPACREQQFREGAFPSLDAVPEQAFTLTIPAILHAKSIQCLVPGAVKQIPVWKALRGEISTACPASILRCHADTTLYLDAGSAALLYPHNEPSR